MEAASENAGAVAAMTLRCRGSMPPTKALLESWRRRTPRAFADKPSDPLAATAIEPPNWLPSMRCPSPSMMSIAASPKLEKPSPRTQVAIRIICNQADAAGLVSNQYQVQRRIASYPQRTGDGNGLAVAVDCQRIDIRWQRRGDIVAARKDRQQIIGEKDMLLARKICRLLPVPGSLGY